MSVGEGKGSLAYLGAKAKKGWSRVLHTCQRDRRMTKGYPHKMTRFRNHLRTKKFYLNGDNILFDKQ